MNGSSLYFVGPGRIEVRPIIVPTPGPGQLLVASEFSAVSAGTEMLLYRGQIPEGTGAEIDPFSNGLSYPTPYGYSVVGHVVDVGSSVDREWLSRRVFAFQPHASHFVVDAGEAMQVPDGVDPLDAVFLPNMETAVNLVQDAAPLLGDRILVLGQGVVGLLTASLLAEFPLASLVTADRLERRRAASTQIGVTAALDPGAPDFRASALAHTGASRRGFDTTIELTGSPDAIDTAVALTGFSGSVVLGSWYGTKHAEVDLGGAFHRSRIKILSSQVSTIAPALSGRWNKSRRFQVAWTSIARAQPGKWVTHRVPIESAASAYQLVDRSPGDCIQVVLTY